MTDYELECTDPRSPYYRMLTCYQYRCALAVHDAQMALFDALYIPQIIGAISRGLRRLGTWILPK